MKKKIMILCIFLFSIAVVTYAQQYYRDDYNGYEGFAVAKYLGTTATINAEQELQKLHTKKITPYRGRCTKLSKAENFLLWSALRKYDFKENEVYNVSIMSFGSDYIELIVTMKDGGKSATFIGNYY